MNLKSVIIIFLLTVCTISGCVRQRQEVLMEIHDDKELSEAEETIKADPTDNDTWIAVCVYLTKQRRFSELRALINPYLHPAEPEKNTLPSGLRLHLAIYYAQSCLFLDDFHEASETLKMIESTAAPDMPDNLVMSYHNISAILAMKMEMDYSKAIFHFNNALALAEKAKDTVNYCALSCNIASVYYEREDTAGINYARNAYEMSSHTCNLWITRSSAIILTRMLILSGDSRKASFYADKAGEYFKDTGDSSLRVSLDIVYGDIAFLRGNHTEAGEHYSKALEAARRNDPASIIEVLFKSGQLMRNTGDYHKAAGFFQEGLELSYCTDNIEYRQKLLLGLSDSYDSMGDKNKALEYYKAYHRLSDSLSLIQKERDFHTLLMNYERMEHKEEQHRSELAIQRSLRHTTIAVAILLVIIVVAAALLYMYRKKNRMYRQLAEQYEKYRQRTRRLLEADEKVGQKKENDNCKDEILYRKIESAMTEGKLWREKDISVEKIAGIVGSNRSYVSRAFNSFAGMSFTSYVNMKRIEEATEMLSSEQDNGLPLKVVADILGFNSLSQFSKVFLKETGCPPSKYRTYSQKGVPITATADDAAERNTAEHCEIDTRGGTADK